MLTSILIALSLNFDTFSASIIEGSQMNKPKLANLLKVGLFFGIGQALMAFIGSILGISFKLITSNIDHWIAFILLSFVGGKMIYDIGIERSDHKKTSIIDTKSLILIVIATSIDSLVVGISFAFIRESIIANLLIIGLVSFITSSIGFYFGNELQSIFRSKIKILGGLVLILIGLKILIEHLLL